ncbi:MAG: hypothetical protein AB8B65_12815 [Kordia sp.]|uniref:hypothetical protein n=1 Tax=Kordia sp. TaxID=1965332 RepID=UPI003859AFF0
MRILITILLYVSMYSVNAQTDLKQNILGKWEFVKITTDAEKNSSTQAKSHLSNAQKDPFMRKDVLLIFRENNDITFEVENFLMQAKYVIKDSILTIGAYKYEILRITKETLYLKALSDSMSANYEYKRIETPKKDKQ